MKLENFTDLQNWATEQWGDAELGDSRHTERAMSTTGYSASQWERRSQLINKEVYRKSAILILKKIRENSVI